MAIYRGVVKNHIIVLEGNVTLPEGTEVEVRLADPAVNREEAFARMRAHWIHHYVGIDEVIEEDKQAREERSDSLVNRGGNNEVVPGHCEEQRRGTGGGGPAA